MKAAVFHAVGQPLSIEDVKDPDPLPGEVIIKVAHCGVCGSDLHATDGHGPTATAGSVLGHEYAGEVVAVGAGVSRLKQGHRLAVIPAIGCHKCADCLSGRPMKCTRRRLNFGGFAEYARCGELEGLLLPQSLTLADGALVEPLAVAIHGMRRAGITPSSRVVVLGAGPVGLAAIFWAQRLGAASIEAIDPSAERRALAIEMGATYASVPLEMPSNTLDNLFAAERAPNAPDIVVECSGVPGLIGTAISCVRPGGRILVLGFCTTAEVLIPAFANMKEVMIDFSITYDMDDFEAAARVLDAGAVEPAKMITRSVALDDLPASFERLRHDKSDCKIMVDL